MQSSLTPEQFQHWQLSQAYQYNAQQKQQAMMWQGAAGLAQQTKPRKPRAKKADAAPESESTTTESAERVEVHKETKTKAPKGYAIDQVPIIAPKMSSPVEVPVPSPVVDDAPAPAAVPEADPVVEPKYGELKRGDLVSLAKERGVKANGKSEAIVKVVSVALCTPVLPWCMSSYKLLFLLLVVTQMKASVLCSAQGR
jgi:hypothetical protein